MWAIAPNFVDGVGWNALELLSTARQQHSVFKVVKA